MNYEDFISNIKNEIYAGTFNGTYVGAGAGTSGDVENIIAVNSLPSFDKTKRKCLFIPT